MHERVRQRSAAIGSRSVAWRWFGCTQIRARTAPSGFMLAGLLLALFCWPTPVVGADLFTELRTFPGVVLLPAAGLAPFDSLEPWRVELNRPLPNSTLPVHGRYLVQYRQPGGGDGSGQVGGTIGRAEFDDQVTMLGGLSFTRCPADAAYCAENVGGRDDADVASEVFRGLTVGDSTAVAVHVICCAGHYWSVAWYDAGRDMTYEIVVTGSTSDRYGAAIDAANVANAGTLTEIAAHLVPLQ
jgi:hypothetical protein